MTLEVEKTFCQIKHLNFIIMKKMIPSTLIVLVSFIGLSAQNLPTIGEVYDFNVGDEFRYEFSQWNTDYYSHKVINVDFTPDSSEVTYTFYREGTTVDWYGDTYPIGPDTVMEIYSNLDSSLHTFFDGWYPWSTYGSPFDTINHISEDLCGVEVFGVPEHSIGYGLWMAMEWGIGLGTTYRYLRDDTEPHSIVSFL